MRLKHCWRANRGNPHPNLMTRKPVYVSYLLPETRHHSLPAHHPEWSGDCRPLVPVAFNAHGVHPINFRILSCKGARKRTQTHADTRKCTQMHANACNVAVCKGNQHKRDWWTSNLCAGVVLCAGEWFDLARRCRAELFSSSGSKEHVNVLLA